MENKDRNVYVCVKNNYFLREECGINIGDEIEVFGVTDTTGIHFVDFGYPGIDTQKTFCVTLKYFEEMFSKKTEQEIMTPQEKQIEAYVDTIAELNKEVESLKKINSQLFQNILKVKQEKRQLKRELKDVLLRISLSERNINTSTFLK